MKLFDRLMRFLTLSKSIELHILCTRKDLITIKASCFLLLLDIICPCAFCLFGWLVGYFFKL